MPPRYPKEFRDDVVQVALNRDPDVTLSQIAKDFGIHVGTLDKWLREERVEHGRSPVSPGPRTLNFASSANVTSSSNKKSRSCAVRLRISRRRICRERLYPLVKELAGDGIPVQVSCRVLKLSRQPYYRWLRKPITEGDHVQAYRAKALHDAHLEGPEFGYRFLADEAKTLGEPMCERTAWRRYRAQQWWSAFGKSKHAGRAETRTACS